MYTHGHVHIYLDYSHITSYIRRQTQTCTHKTFQVMLNTVLLHTLYSVWVKYCYFVCLSLGQSSRLSHAAALGLLCKLLDGTSQEHLQVLCLVFLSSVTLL